jgi:hypothetical protein
MGPDHSSLLRETFAEWERGNLEPGSERFAADIRFSAAQPEGQVHATGPEEATQHGTGKSSGVETAAPAFITISFRGPEIAQLEFHFDRGKALEAATEL